MKKESLTKMALIPPIPELPWFGTGSFHLLLSHLLVDPRYKSHYRTQREEHGAYLLLDNSAHELGAGEDAEDLMLKAIDLQAQEVVVPDVLANAEGTVEKAISTHELWYESSYSGMINLNPALMYVPQGNNRKEWEECMWELARIHFHTARRWRIRRDFVLGISKDYETWDEGLLGILLNPVVNLLGHYKATKIQIHLLGWGRQLWKLQELTRLSHLHIRSVDSAKPFVYARKRIELNPGKAIPKYPTRPSDYFSRKFTPAQRKVALHNVDVFRRMANA